MKQNSFTVTAAEISSILVGAFERREGVFSDTKELLENQLPVGVTPLSKEHANFLFFLISQDHGVKSAKLYERAKALYQRDPLLFHPSHLAAHYQRERFEQAIGILQSLGVRYPNSGARVWVENAHALRDEYSSDARNIFVGDSAAVIKQIRALRGFGPKTGGLLFRVFVGLGLYLPPDSASIPFPTDIHDTRIAALTGLAEIPIEITESTYSPYVKLAEEVWRRGSLSDPHCQDHRSAKLRYQVVLKNYRFGSKMNIGGRAVGEALVRPLVVI